MTWELEARTATSGEEALLGAASRTSATSNTQPCTHVLGHDVSRQRQQRTPTKAKAAAACIAQHFQRTNADQTAIRQVPTAHLPHQQPSTARATGSQHTYTTHLHYQRGCTKRRAIIQPSMLEVAGMAGIHGCVTAPSSHILQAYLKFSNVDFRVTASSNHASPSGALPFLLPVQPDTLKPVQPVPSGKLQRWTMNSSETVIEESGDLRYEAYLSLLDHRIRRAWVCDPIHLLGRLLLTMHAALQHLPLTKLHIHRRTTLHPFYVKQSLRPPHNSARAPAGR